jgi:hypothetical protein
MASNLDGAGWKNSLGAMHSFRQTGLPGNFFIKCSRWPASNNKHLQSDDITIVVIDVEG